MPRIFDNLTAGATLAPALQETLSISSRADFCVGYFNLRGWGNLAPYVDAWNPEEGPCRLLVGMEHLPNQELRESLTLRDQPPGMDNATAQLPNSSTSDCPPTPTKPPSAVCTTNSRLGESSSNSS